MSDLTRSTRTFLALVLIYGMLICGIGAFGQSTPGANRRPGANSPEMQAMKGYRLSMDKVDKFGVASRNLIALAKTKPSMKADMQSNSGAKNIDDAARLLESKHPEAASVIQKAGLSVREYFEVSLTLAMTTMVAGMQRSGQPLKQLPANVSAENLAFVQQNYPKIEKMLKSLNQENQ